MSPLVIGMAFLSGFLVVFGINVLIADFQLKRKEELKERMRHEARALQQERARMRLKHKELAALAADAGALEDRMTWRERIVVLLDQAGNPMNQAQLFAFSLGLLAIGSLAGQLIFRNIPLAAGSGLLLGCAPWMYVFQLRSKRLGKLRMQLTDGFDLMARTIRAGQSLPQALLAIADEAASPMAEEFGYCYDQQNLGMSAEASMRDLARRTGLLEVRIFVLAVLIQRQTGGNLAELLDKLSEVIRERYRIQGLITGLTAEGKMQAAVLMGLPVAMFFIMYAINRPYAQILLEKPWLVGTTLGMMGLGGAWIYRIINFDH